jgi:4-amino-4-deoxy-L-arabinose transferase-like glycosyltransferase
MVAGQPQRPLSRDRLAIAILAALLALGAIVYFVDLGGSSIWDANEAFYVETPREMIEARDFVNPTFNYLPRFNKPVLSYWIVAGFYRIAGVSVAVQRVPIAVGAMILIGCAWVLASLASNGRTTDPGRRTTDDGRRLSAALWASVGLAADPRLVMFARRIFIDVWISAFLALTLAFFALSEQYPDRRRLYLGLMYVSVGLGTLTKGPVAVVLPGLAFALYLIANRELGRIREMMIPLGIVIVAAIVLPWYTALYREHGWTEIKSFLLTENLERYTAGEGVRQARGILFYIPVVLSDAFPLSPLLVAAAAFWWRGRDRVQTLLWCWIVAIVGFFTLSAGKQDLYIFPIVPAVAALGGVMLSRMRGDDRVCRHVRWTMMATGVALTVAGASVLYVFETADGVYALKGTMAVSILAMLGGALATVFAIRYRPWKSAVVVVAAVIVVDWVFVVRVLPDFERYKPVVPMSDTIARRLVPGDIVAHYQVALPSMVYYLRRHVDQYFDEQPFLDAMASRRRVYAVLSEGDYDALRPRLGSACVIERRPTFDVKLRNILSREPPPELLLITNDCRQ